MKFFTVDDLQNILDTFPCSTKKGYISYSKLGLIEMIRKDFNGERLFQKQQDWNNEVPMIYGLGTTTPYSKEVEAFAKSQKTHGGGRNLIVMNGAYFSNARYIIENRYWDLQQDTFKKDTRKKIRNVISTPVKTKNETELRKAVEQLLNEYYGKLNKNIDSLNDFLKSKCSQFVFYLNFYKASYVQQLIGNPAELLLLLDNQRDVMEDGFEPLSVPYDNQKKFIDNIIQLLSKELLYNDIERINTISDRIYSRETPLIQQLRKIYNEFGMIKTKAYQLEEAIKIETESRIRTSEGIFPDSLIIQHAKDNGLISISFRLSDK